MQIEVMEELLKRKEELNLEFLNLQKKSKIIENTDGDFTEFNIMESELNGKIQENLKTINLIKELK